ncbi:uncharacterized protein LOC100905451 [Galendromus occidentalis]|uniref:Uncharacterized protein LOC100905451 n=1 Tax=Galendromus occidentalis TaxID=34638 RepID=A0AAJ6W0Z1_9ACAR|nr:uncharacterized protein LOC100905451 [Galendromus occidentalis]
MTLSSPQKADQKSPKLPLRRPNREALELLKQSPSTLRDATPPHQNTRSKRNKQAAASSKSPPDESVPRKVRKGAEPRKENKNVSPSKSIALETPPSQGIRSVKSPLVDQSSRKNRADLEETRLIEVDDDSQTTPKSVPPTPLNTALIETPRVDLTPRAVRRQPFQQGERGRLPYGGLMTEIYRLEAQSQFEHIALESTEVVTVVESEDSSHARPPRWSLRQLSPIRNVEETHEKGEVSSSFGAETTFGVEDVGVQVSLCQRCNAHSAWSEMKPIVMVFVLMMLSLLYRGLLRVDPRLPQGFGNALGIAVQGTFLASFNLEDYLTDIFAV